MKKYSFLLLYFYSPMLLATLIFISNPIKYSDLSILLSMLLGVCAFTWLSWQFVISARPKYIEKKIGMDKLYRLHGFMAIVSLAFTGLHQIVNNQLFSDNLMIRIGKTSFLIFAIVSLLSVIFMVSSKITSNRTIKLLKEIIGKVLVFKYEHLKLMHNLTFIALVIMLMHVLMTSTVRNNLLVFTGYMSYFSIAFGYYFYHKIIKLWLIKENNYEITEVANEGPKIWRIELKGKSEGFNFKPGQFAFFRFWGKHRGQEHPFTIASVSQEGDQLSILVKELGDFSSSMSEFKVGGKVSLEGPYGTFSYLNHSSEEQLIFLAGGIGITPVLSMLQHMAENSEKRKVLVIWGIKNEEDIIMQKKLMSIQRKLPELSIVPVVSNQPNYDGEKGFVTLELLEKLFEQNRIKLFKAGCYMCGPEIFMSTIKKALLEMGAKNEMIHDERFSL